VERYYSDEKFMALAKNHRGLRSIISEIEKERRDAEIERQKKITDGSSGLEPGNR
jgi:hypothetical protein